MVSEQSEEQTTHSTGDTERSECTIMDCSGEAEFAYWMPDLGQFSRTQDPEHDLLDDGDLAPYVCESCRDRMAAGPHWHGERFVNPREKLVADGGTERAVAEMGALKLSVRVDGEWCPEVRWYTPDLPVFIADDGTEVDIRDDGSILYESPDGAVEEIDPAVDREAKQIYEPMSVYPADTVEVRDVRRRPIRSESADFGGGGSTGVQDL